ncbi:MAG: competence/damage-inducible protein A [Phyllobacteriaceae bacterium]|nr:competence/damage-inducible protein A [Phyllobacteriaceae bacterium]
MPKTVTAAMLAIGDELLSGRTKDRNIGYLADFLTLKGIDLKEVRIVADDEAAIVEALNALRERYTYVFTSGGIGPTHDDITADAVAAAFEVEIDHDPKAVDILLTYFQEIGREPNEARMRMARIPKGASLIDNPVSRAPGFQMGNVFVMAGVPKIMNAMMDDVAKRLTRGIPMVMRQIEFRGGEGDCAKPLGEIQKRFPAVVIGSYPFQAADGFATNLVLRSRDSDALEQAFDAVRAMAADLTQQGKARGWS